MLYLCQDRPYSTCTVAERNNQIVHLWHCWKICVLFQKRQRNCNTVRSECQVRRGRQLKDAWILLLSSVRYQSISLWGKAKSRIRTRTIYDYETRCISMERPRINNKEACLLLTVTILKICYIGHDFTKGACAIIYTSGVEKRSG